MIIYIRGGHTHAGKPIYKGFAAAWEHLGYEVRYYDELCRLVDKLPTEYELMLDDTEIGGLVHGVENPVGLTQMTNPDTNCLYTVDETRKIYQTALNNTFTVIKNSSRAYCFTQPNTFPLPWGKHFNFVSLLSKHEDIRDIFNNEEHIKTWTWVDQTEVARNEYYKGWSDVNTIPLAFDHISYQEALGKEKAPEYDLCYVGGWADNGFDEKRKIMMEHFAALLKTKLKCGIFINKNVSFEYEAALLHNSKIALNIHDEYQRVLGLDSNERTFKSLGLTGALVCDNVGQISRLFPELPLYKSPEQMVEQIMNLLDDTKKLTEQKEYYRDLLLKEHTYVHRVEQMRDL